MRVVMFVHSILSDWNNGNAHFLRGIASELQSRGHQLRVFEPVAGWSRTNLVKEEGAEAIDGFRAAYPTLDARLYDPATIDLDEALDGAALVLVHEWNDVALVRRLGEHRRRGGRHRLLFHDTHHRAVTAPESMARFELAHFDGVLAFGEVIRELYQRHGWSRQAWTWHEAADTRIFRPLPSRANSGDLVWIGNWGDDERTVDLENFLLAPVQALGLDATVYGVRYPESAQRALAASGVRYRGWLPNHEAPEVFARHRVTVHVPRRPFVEALPGIPTIRIFEALACGIPLVSAPWRDVEGLFIPGEDYLVANDGAGMQRHLRALLADHEMARELARSGRERVLARHTCAHRVDALLAILARLA